MLGKTRIDQRSLGLVQEDPCIRVDHRGDFHEVTARQRIFAARQDFVRVPLPADLLHSTHSCSFAFGIGEEGFQFDQADSSAFRSARMPRANWRSMSEEISGVG